MLSPGLLKLSVPTFTESKNSCMSDNVFPAKEGILLPADPVDRAVAKVEGNTVLDAGKGPLGRVEEDLTYDSATYDDGVAGAGVTSRDWPPPTSGLFVETTLSGCTICHGLLCSSLRRRWTLHLFHWAE